jgi:hypothetical protein
MERGRMEWSDTVRRREFERKCRILSLIELNEWYIEYPRLYRN